MEMAEHGNLVRREYAQMDSPVSLASRSDSEPVCLMAKAHPAMVTGPGQQSGGSAGDQAVAVTGGQRTDSEVEGQGWLWLLIRSVWVFPRNWLLVSLVTLLVEVAAPEHSLSMGSVYNRLLRPFPPTRGACHPSPYLAHKLIARVGDQEVTSPKPLQRTKTTSQQPLLLPRDRRNCRLRCVRLSLPTPVWDGA